MNHSMIGLILKKVVFSDHAANMIFSAKVDALDRG